MHLLVIDLSVIPTVTSICRHETSIMKIEFLEHSLSTWGWNSFVEDSCNTEKGLNQCIIICHTNVNICKMLDWATNTTRLEYSWRMLYKIWIMSCFENKNKKNDQVRCFLLIISYVQYDQNKILNYLRIWYQWSHSTFSEHW